MTWTRGFKSSNVAELAEQIERMEYRLSSEHPDCVVRVKAVSSSVDRMGFVHALVVFEGRETV